MKNILPTVNERANFAGANNTIGNPMKKAMMKNSADNAAMMKNPVRRLVLEISGQILSHLWGKYLDK